MPNAQQPTTNNQHLMLKGLFSLLPAFFEKTFGLEHVVAGMIAATYPFLNLISRPSGGLISDKFGSRKWTITIISAGIGVGYLMVHFINSSWPLPLAIAATMFAAYQC